MDAFGDAPQLLSDPLDSPDSPSAGNKEGARLFAENAIRQKSQHMNFLRLSARIDAVSSKLANAVQMNMVSTAAQCEPSHVTVTVTKLLELSTYSIACGCELVCRSRRRCVKSRKSWDLR